MTNLDRYNQKYLLNIFPKNSIGLEIGVFRGDFSSEIINNLSPKMFYMIDPWIFRPNWKGKKYKGQNIIDQKFVEEMYIDICKRFDRTNIKIFRGYSHDFVNKFENEYLDFIYLDARHKYVHVKRDLELFYPKLKVGGIMSGDDWITKENGNGVEKAVTEFTKKLGITPTIRKTQFWWVK